MDGLKITFDFSGVGPMHNMLLAAGKKAPTAIRRAVNHAGAKTRTAMVRALIPQTGLKSSTIKRALKATRAFDGGPSGFVQGAGSLDYVITSRGGDVALKYFKPTEKGPGVSAKPWGSQHFYKGAFKKSAYGLTRGGKQMRRINVKFHGNVFENVEGGKWGGKMKVVKSGLTIPDEMMSGATAAAFYRVSESELRARIEHELLYILGEIK